MKESLPKKQRLRSRKAIQAIFSSGKVLQEKPIKVFFLVRSEKKGLEAGFSVPRKLFKKAHDRNLLRRRMKEAYRRNKNATLGTCLLSGPQLHLFWIYTSTKPSDYKTIADKIIVLLQRLEKEIA